MRPDALQETSQARSRASSTATCPGRAAATVSAPTPAMIESPIASSRRLLPDPKVPEVGPSAPEKRGAFRLTLIACWRTKGKRGQKSIQRIAAFSLLRVKVVTLLRRRSLRNPELCSGLANSGCYSLNQVALRSLRLRKDPRLWLTRQQEGKTAGESSSSQNDR